MCPRLRWCRTRLCEPRKVRAVTVVVDEGRSAQCIGRIVPSADTSHVQPDGMPAVLSEGSQVMKVLSCFADVASPLVRGAERPVAQTLFRYGT